jgi:hypothetical protein
MSAKKVTIEKKDLPPLTPNGEYLIRYRIISEDKNRTSHWSPIYTVDALPFIADVSGDLQISNGSLAINTVWEASTLVSSYDIFVSFGIYNVGTATIAWDSYVYHGSSASTSYSFLRPDAVTDIRVKVQLSGIEKTLSPLLEICSLQKTRR